MQQRPFGFESFAQPSFPSAFSQQSGFYAPRSTFSSFHAPPQPQTLFSKGWSRPGQSSFTGDPYSQFSQPSPGFRPGFPRPGYPGSFGGPHPNVIYPNQRAQHTGAPSFAGSIQSGMHSESFRTRSQRSFISKSRDEDGFDGPWKGGSVRDMYRDHLQAHRDAQARQAEQASKHIGDCFDSVKAKIDDCLSQSKTDGCTVETLMEKQDELNQAWFGFASSLQERIEHEQNISELNFLMGNLDAKRYNEASVADLKKNFERYGPISKSDDDGKPVKSPWSFSISEISRDSTFNDDDRIPFSDDSDESESDLRQFTSRGQGSAPRFSQGISGGMNGSSMGSSRFGGTGWMGPSFYPSASATGWNNSTGSGYRPSTVFTSGWGASQQPSAFSGWNGQFRGFGPGAGFSGPGQPSSTAWSRTFSFGR
ncbi:hypothetical protein I203_105414 [Kwoniella mangroviensis CBS 8507]|uniref:uncharacterized protein n=1 Tax=Kwoniella mangroviensis CBS 8507 TaxID=1296122 RepID=UPI00080CD0B6|nr:uncharacterized protein I203_01230 [Kwoniella mangroviensis CBS 8507]OCF69373.1 hypothetical protein I203_01230 [Kwoniella mangroviensis CBS 8507]